MHGTAAGILPAAHKAREGRERRGKAEKVERFFDN
jgi:hypothetical protein